MIIGCQLIATVSTSSTIYAAVGRNVTLKCETESNVYEISLRWRRENKHICSNGMCYNSRYLIKRNTERRLFNLLISPVKNTDFCEFFCDWQTEFGTKSAKVKLGNLQ